MEIKKIVSATEFSLSYRIILCDLWGVIHNGVEVFSNAKSYLEAMKENNIDVYLIDTYGEAKKFLRYSKFIFTGGSIITHGGQNPLEAARLGCKVIHGPNISNFMEVYNLLKKNNISSQINNLNNAKAIINKNLNNNYNYKKITKRLNSIGNEVLIKNKKEISKYI